jgi:hypothetical protein
MGDRTCRNRRSATGPSCCRCRPNHRSRSSRPWRRPSRRDPPCFRRYRPSHRDQRCPSCPRCPSCLLRRSCLRRRSSPWPVVPPGPLYLPGRCPAVAADPAWPVVPALPGARATRRPVPRARDTTGSLAAQPIAPPRNDSQLSTRVGASCSRLPGKHAVIIPLPVPAEIDIAVLLSRIARDDVGAACCWSPCRRELAGLWNPPRCPR